MRDQTAVTQANADDDFEAPGFDPLSANVEDDDLADFDLEEEEEEAELTDLQEEFCRCYVLCPNATKAARRAGYSSNNARFQGSRLLANPKIVERIAELRVDLGVRNRIDQDTVMAKLEAIYSQAMYRSRFDAAARAVTVQARLAGLFPDQVGSVVGRAAGRDANAAIAVNDGIRVAQLPGQRARHESA